MCGIFGVIAKEDCGIDNKILSKILYHLGEESESRGKDSSGLSILNNVKKELNIFKGPLPASELIKNTNLKNSISQAFRDENIGIMAFGHSRLVTNGSQLNTDNNQPVIKDNLVGVHNGIIVNHQYLWEKYKNLKKQYEIDTEVLLSIIAHKIRQNNHSLEKIISYSLNEVRGTVATGLFINDLNKFVLATNNGSLYFIGISNKFLIFASEENILNKIARKVRLNKKINNFNVEQLTPDTGIVVDIDSLDLKKFNFSNHHEKKIDYFDVKNQLKLKVKNINPDGKQHSVVMDLNFLHKSKQAEKEIDLLKYPLQQIQNLKRCKKCILPETFPFIFFDDLGICNYCKNYKQSKKKKSIDELIKLVDPYRKSGGLPEVLVPFSGGRDSTYTLHVIKEELGLKPITFTYDWGMVTDLARRNIARTCGKLKVENIIVAANIHWKRENIKNNITAWLKNPALGMIPLFMAGDKYFFYHAHKIKKQLGINLEIWGVNALENTDFKIGFAGIKPNFNKKRIYSISALNQFNLLTFVAKNVITSPGYLNKSVFDSMGSIISRYFTSKRDYFHLFDYIEWDEDIINNTIIDKYEWEKAVDTKSTWRIGDGTASFYNYVYTLIGGFCENDTFRSNQIREGMIKREEALNLVYQENKPRYNSLKWYLEIIGLDYKEIINRLNNLPRMY